MMQIVYLEVTYAIQNSKKINIISTIQLQNLIARSQCITVNYQNLQEQNPYISILNPNITIIGFKIQKISQKHVRFIFMWDEIVIV